MTAASRDLARRLNQLGDDETLPVIGRCPACRVHVRLEVPATVTLPDGRAPWRAAPWLAHYAAWCVTHRHALRFAALRSEYVPGRPCGASCRHASSATCRCACGGANHGVAP